MAAPKSLENNVRPSAFRSACLRICRWDRCLPFIVRLLDHFVLNFSVFRPRCAGRTCPSMRSWVLNFRRFVGSGARNRAILLKRDA